MNGIVHERGLATFEDPVPDDLRGDPGDDQYNRNRPHAGRAHMAHDQRGGRKQHHRSTEDRCSKCPIEQQPIDQHRHYRDGRRTGLHTKRRHRPRAQRKDGSQEQKHDADHMQRAIPGIAVIFDVIRKLPLEKFIHARFAAVFASVARAP